MKKAWTIGVLLLPLLGLSAMAARNSLQLMGASEWQIPVEGYDPRDLLAGHYAQFRMSWAVGGKPQLCADGGCAFCLEETSAGVTAIAVKPETSCPHYVDPVKSGLGVTWPGEFSSGGGPVVAGRIYVPERDAVRITQILSDRNALLIARLGRDGRLMPERIVAKSTN